MNTTRRKSKEAHVHENVKKSACLSTFKRDSSKLKERLSPVKNNEISGMKIKEEGKGLRDLILPVKPLKFNNLETVSEPYRNTRGRAAT